MFTVKRVAALAIAGSASLVLAASVNAATPGQLCHTGPAGGYIYSSLDVPSPVGQKTPIRIDSYGSTHQGVATYNVHISSTVSGYMHRTDIDQNSCS